MPESYYRSDRKKKSTPVGYRVLNNGECFMLAGKHCAILDSNGLIAEVKVTSVADVQRQKDL